MAEADGPRRSIGKVLRRVGGAIADGLYPPTCLACETALATPDTLCAACFAGLQPIGAPLCPVYGVPFSRAPGGDMVSPEALADPPPFARARAAVLYGPVAQTLVAGLKYADRPELARFCAPLMVEAGRVFWDDHPILVPIPLHRRRLLRRRYNQSAELARAVARGTGLGLDLSVLVRARATRAQVGLSRDGRQRNVAGAFSAHPETLRRLAGRGVVLVDDVYTTGATVKAAARALLRAGAAQVDVLTFARVVSEGEIPI